MMGFSISTTRLVLGAAAALLFLGTALYAATAPGVTRPRASDLPVISVMRDVNAHAAPREVAPTDVATTPIDAPTTSDATPAITSLDPESETGSEPRPNTGDSDDDDDREVVSPPVREQSSNEHDEDREVVSPPVRDEDHSSEGSDREDKSEDRESSSQKKSSDED